MSILKASFQQLGVHRQRSDITLSVKLEETAFHSIQLKLQNWKRCFASICNQALCHVHAVVLTVVDSI